MPGKVLHVTMSLEQKYGLGRFDGRDYDYWRFRLLTIIRAEELDYVLEQPESEDGTDGEASGSRDR